MARKLDIFIIASIIYYIDANTWYGGARYVIEFFM